MGHLIASTPWGTLPSWLTVAALIGAVVWLPRRASSGPAIQSLEANNRVLEAANGSLERRVHELEQQGKVDASTIAELRGRTDVTLALAPIVEWSTRHEERAQQRHVLSMEQLSKHLDVLDLIAKRLGGEPNGNGHDQEREAA